MTPDFLSDRDVYRRAGIFRETTREALKEGEDEEKRRRMKSTVSSLCERILKEID